MRLLTIAITLAAFSAPAHSFTIFNGGFEDGDSPWKIRNGWARVSDGCREGNFCIRYDGEMRQRRASLTRQTFMIEQAGHCELSLWIKTRLTSEAFHRDGEPSRHGVSMQLIAPSGRRVRIDLGAKNVYREGCRGVCGETPWIQYTGTLDMEAGRWRAWIYAHSVRKKMRGRIRVVRNASGRAWVDGVVLRRLD